jgi:hypothetical protein
VKFFELLPSGPPSSSTALQQVCSFVQLRLGSLNFNSTNRNCLQNIVQTQRARPPLSHCISTDFTKPRTTASLAVARVKEAERLVAATHERGRGGEEAKRGAKEGRTK